MSSEWRPRIRLSRKRPVTRKGNVIVVVCKDDADATAVADFLETMFAAAKRDEEKAKAIREQIKLDAQVTALVGADLKEGVTLADDAEFTPVEALPFDPSVTVYPPDMKSPEDLANTPPEAL